MLIGLIIGFVFGALLASLMAVSGRASEEEEHNAEMQRLREELHKARSMQRRMARCIPDEKLAQMALEEITQWQEKNK